MYSSRGLRGVFVYRVNILLKLHIISTVRIDAPHYHKTKCDNTSHERDKIGKRKQPYITEYATPKPNPETHNFYSKPKTKTQTVHDPFMKDITPTAYYSSQQPITFSSSQHLPS
jgi:hypothetical protein